MTELSLSLLGPFQASLGTEPLDDFRTRKVQALLIYLAAEPEAHTRDALLDLLWPGLPERSARSNLRQILYQLRKALPEVRGKEVPSVAAVIANRKEIRLNPQAAVDVDAGQFESLLDGVHAHDHLDLFLCRTCADELQAAVALYRGHFLADFYLDDSNQFEEWAQTRREYVRRRALDALGILTTMAIRARDFAEAQAYAEKQLEIDNLRESAYRQLMETLALSGRREQALAVYERCRRTLTEELGMTPSARTTAYYEKVLAGDLRFDSFPRQGVRGYELKEQIGEGAYGVVYRAVQPAVRRQVAVKVIARRHADDADFIRRFEAEAQTVARLEHPYIVPLYDYWRDPAGAYLVMRYMSGGSLLGALEGGPWDGERAAGMVEQVADALAIAHRQGVVHRDIKPANILLDEAGNAYLADFGIAREKNGERPVTGSGATLDYVSPEQITGDEVSQQADIYSLGAVLYETLTGEKPFGDATLARLLHSHLHEPMPLVAATRPDVPPEVDAVLQKATAKEPGARYDTAQEMAAAFRGAVRGVAADTAGHVRESMPALVDVYNPYKGLHAFQESDADDFFGREALVDQLAGRLEASRFLALVGPSGSGKSSAVKAGLIPALRQGALPGSDRWFIAEMVPGTNPLAELEMALWHVAVDAPPNLVEPMERDTGGILRTVRRILPQEPAAHHGRPQLLLLIDQFEELFTLVEDDDRREFFLDSLLAAMEAPRSPLRVVVTLRADLYDRPLQYQAWGQLLKQNTEIVLPLNRTELTWAIREPAARMGVRLEEGLAGAIVADVADQPGALPLLQYTMTELFERRSNGQMTRDAYEAVGGVQGALGRRAEALYGELSEQGREAARQLFLRLVTLGEGVEDTRRRVLRSELEALATPEDTAGKAQPPLEIVLDRFGTARFLTFDHDPHTREPTVEVAHEALLREWPRLRRWLDQSRDDVRLQRLLAQAAAEWENAGQDAGFLLRGARLDQFAGWAEGTSLALTADEEAYLAAGVTAREARDAAERARQQREARLERRSRNFLMALVVVFALATVLSGGFGIFAVDQREAAQTQAAVLLAAQAESELDDGFSERAVLLALEALEHFPYTSQAEHALGQAVSFNRALQRYGGHSSAITSIDWSPDGTRVATSSTDNTVRIWDAVSGEERLLIELPEGITGNIYDWALTVRWTSDGSKLLTMTGDRFLLGSQDYVLILWDATTGERLKMIELRNQAIAEAGEGTPTSGDHYATATAAALGPTGGQLATVGGDNTAIIWDAKLEAPALVLIGHENDVNGVDWSPDETRLATASEDGTVRIWDAQSGEELLTLSGHDGAVNQASWSPDGSQLASAGKDGTVRFWNALSGELVQSLDANGGIVWSLAWSPDGSYMATGTNDAIIRFWEIDSQQVIFELRGHENFIYHLVWSPTDGRLANADASGLAYVWNVAPSTAVFSLLNRSFMGLDWSSNSRHLALAGGEGLNGNEPDNLSVWDVLRGQLVAENLVSREGWYHSTPHYSPDDNLLLLQGFKGPFVSIPVADWEAKTFVVDTETGEDVKTFAVQEDGTIIRAAFWLPDGRRIAAGTLSGTLAVWDYQTGDLLTTRKCGNVINNLDWSPDSERIAVSCRERTNEDIIGWIEIVNAATGETLLTLSDSDPATGTPWLWLVWSPDGTRLLSTGGDDQVGTLDNPVIIWDTDTGERLLTITRHTRNASSGSWSPDGSRIATTSNDDTARVWDAETGAELLTLPLPANFLSAARWSPDGRHLAVGAGTAGGGPGRAEVWRVWQSTDELIEYAYGCCVFRELTAEERVQFGLLEAASSTGD